jgi:hypothetical protein
MKLPYTTVEFDKDGALVRPAEVGEAAALIAAKDATDVIVISHGWNNTHADAEKLYEAFFDSFDAVTDRVPAAADRSFVVVGVLWPSIRWAPPDDDADEGAGAGLDDDATVLQEEIREQVDDPAVAKRLSALVPTLDSDPHAQHEFLTLLRSTLPASSPGEDASAFEALATSDPDQVIAAAKVASAPAPLPAAQGGAADVGPILIPGVAGGDVGGAAGILSDIVQAGRNLLNVTTYYTMKGRAGAVGSKGIAPMIDALHAKSPSARIHLIGHSFGGRAVTAAANAASAPVSSLSLLQAAYSHFGMAKDWDGAGENGSFVAVPGRVVGPIIDTHTVHDKAVGIAYPLASRLANQIGAGLGDQDDPYGGIGRNGALKTPGNVMATLLDVGGAYDFTGDHTVWSLQADAYVMGHSDITGPQVAYAVLCAVTSAPA